MTSEITVLGMVQGIGFRPFVARLAEELDVTGAVRNSGGIVKITASASAKAMDTFVRRLRSHCPPGAQILDIAIESLPERKFAGFDIIGSETEIIGTPVIPADLPVCADCLREMNDPGNRRYRHPFISCTACGPRYSIIDRLPYDRDTTTMEDFPMCGACAEEYTGKGRRRHAQTISCHECGPQLILRDSAGTFEKGAALDRAISHLKSEKILAVKGIGGYQFACSPCSGEAVKRLRLLKQRDKKPFAVMFPGLNAIREQCEVSGEEEALLLSPARPIVLLQKRKDLFAGNVSGESRMIGAFLPYTPLHRLLTDACGPLIMTSGNLSSEPIIKDDDAMLSFASPYLDGVLYNTRKIRVPLDDSVARVVCGTPQVLRRSRGYVPLPLPLPQKTEKPLLAMGGDLKACFCLAGEGRAYLSQYFGDLEHYDVLQSYRDNLCHMERLFGLSPQSVACDMHPGYHSAALARKISGEAGIPLIEIQHHHAHIASVMAEHDLSGCIGVAFDGTGFGTGGAVWGGEFLLCRGADFERAGHLDEISMAGGDASMKDAMLGALCHLHSAGIESSDRRFPLVRAALEKRISTVQNTSMGRLFDAVSALLGLRCYNSYESECAIALENAAAEALHDHVPPYPLSFEICESNDGLAVSRTGLIRELTAAKADTRALALGFHWAVAEAVLEMCRRIRAKTRENRVALSGGVFANRLLTEQCLSCLEKDGFTVYINSAVPCNDGGISLGQAWIASSKQVKGV